MNICLKYLAESAGAQETAIGKPQAKNEKSELLLVRALVMGLKHPIFVLKETKESEAFPDRRQKGYPSQRASNRMITSCGFPLFCALS